MVGAGIAFTVMVACVKVARAELTAFEVVAWRGVVAIPLALWWNRRGPFVPVARGLTALRVALGFVAMSCFYTAAHGLSVADLSLVGRLQPVLIALAAPALLGRAESVDPRVWGVLVAGVVGTAVLLGPQLAVGNIYGLWGLGAVLASAAAHMSLRALARTDKASTVVFWFQVGVTTFAVAAVIATEGHLPALPAPALLPWLAGVGLAGTVGQALLTEAYAADRAAVVAAASHVSPVWGLVADALVFAILPGWTTLAGGGLLIAAAIALVLLPPRPAP